VLAAEFGSAKCLRFCLDNGATVNDEFMNSAIEESRTYTTSTQMLELLFERRWRQMNEVVLSKLAGQAIRLPKPGGDTSRAVQWMLDHGATLKSNDIKEAVKNRVHEKTLAILISSDRKASTTFGSVHTAIIDCNPEAVKLLLEAGASPDHPWWEGFDIRDAAMNTPLIEAISPSKFLDPDSPEKLRKRLAIARLLLEHGADYNERGAYGDTAVKAASRCKVGGAQFRNLLEEFGVYTTKDSVAVSTVVD
jgi:hypothetical protein